MKAALRLSILLLSLSTITAAHADRVSLAGITFGGTGCAANGAGIKILRRSRSNRIVIYTPDMKSEVSGLGRVTCNIALPVKVPPGKQLVLKNPSVFGFTSLATGEKADALSEIFFAGSGSGPRADKEIIGADVADEYYYTRKTGRIALPCEQDGILRVRTALTSTGPAKVRGLAFDAALETCTGP